MNKNTNYFILSGLFVVVYLVVEFTNIYGNSGWFKAFLLILAATFLLSGFSKEKKNSKDS